MNIIQKFKELYQKFKMKRKADLRFRKNQHGRWLGYGSCKICRDSYHWKPYHVINFSDSRGALPYCEECHETTSVEQKKKAADKLITSWMTNDFWAEDWDELRMQIHQAIEEGK